MTIEFRNFLLKVFTVTIAVSAAMFLYFYSVNFKGYTWIYPSLVAFFLIATIGIHTMLLRYSKKSFGKFNAAFMLLNGIKVFLLVLFLAIYGYFNREQLKLFIAMFFVLYVIYSVLEISSLLKYFKKSKEYKFN